MKKWIDFFQGITLIFAYIDLLGIIPHSRSTRTLLLVALPSSLLASVVAYIRKRFYEKKEQATADPLRG